MQRGCQLDSRKAGCVFCDLKKQVSERLFNLVLIAGAWGLLIALGSIVQVPLTDGTFILLLFATIIGNILPLDIRVAQLTEAFAFEYLAIMILGPVSAAWIGVVGICAQGIVSKRKTFIWYLRNTSIHTLSILGAGAVFYALGGRSILVNELPIHTPWFLIPVFAGAITHWVVNIALAYPLILLRNPYFDKKQLWNVFSWDFIAKLIFAPLAFYVFVVYGSATVVELLPPVAFLTFMWILIRKSADLSVMRVKLAKNIEQIEMQRDVARIANSSLSMGQVLETIVKSISDIGGLGLGAVHLALDNKISDKPSAISSGYDDIHKDIFDTKLFKRLLRITYSRGAPTLITKPEQITRLMDSSGKNSDRSKNVGLIAIYPLKTENVEVGTMTLVSRDPLHLKSGVPETIEFLSHELAGAILRSQLHEGLKRAYDERNEELRYAAKVQKILLPNEFMNERVKIETSFTPARILGGDFFEIYQRPDGLIAIAVGDVSGKGVPAALTMMRILSLLRQLTRTARKSIDVLYGLNSELDWEQSEDKSVSQYATCFFALFDPKTGYLSYSNAGHVCPFVYVKEEDSLKILKGGGLPLGMFPIGKYEEFALMLKPGDKLIMYTDGATDAIDLSGDRFTSKRLSELVIRKCREEGNAAQEIHDEIMQYSKNAKLSDDIAIVTLEYFGGLFGSEEADEAGAVIGSVYDAFKLY